MKVSSGNRGTSFVSGRQVTFTVTGLAKNDFSRTADLVMNVPYTRMNETMRMVQRLGGRITGVNVSGGDLASGSAASAPKRKAPNKAKADD